MLRLPRAEALAAIKQHSPVSVRVHKADGEIVDLGIAPGKRTRWHRFGQTLDAYEWVRVEMLDAKKHVIGVIENADAQLDAPDSLGDLDQAGQFEGKLGEAAWFTKMILAAQDLALRRQNERSERMEATMVQLLEVYSAKIVELERLIHQVRMAPAPAAGGDLADTAEEMLFSAIGAKVAGGGFDKKEMGKFVGRVVRDALRAEGPKLVREALSSPAPAAGTPANGSPSAGTPGTGENGQNS